MSLSSPAFGIVTVLDLLFLNDSVFFCFKGGANWKLCIIFITDLGLLTKLVSSRFMFKVWGFSGSVAELFQELCSPIDMNMSPSSVVKLAV